MISRACCDVYQYPCDTRGKWKLQVNERPAFLLCMFPDWESGVQLYTPSQGLRTGPSGFLTPQTFIILTNVGFLSFMFNRVGI